MESTHPVDARLPDDHHLLIEWSDGRNDLYPLDFLRAKCPCAQCVDEWTGEVRVERSMFPGIGLRSLDEAGNYAFRIGFTDGHDTGLYTFRRLREIGQPVERSEPESPFDV